TQRRATLPSTRVEEDDVAGRDLHPLHSFERLEILAVDGGSRFQPALRGGLAGQSRGVEQDAASDDAVFRRVDTAARAAASRLDVLHGHAVVTLAVHHDVAVHGVEMTVNYSMVRARVLVPVQCDVRG